MLKAICIPRIYLALLLLLVSVIGFTTALNLSSLKEFIETKFSDTKGFEKLKIDQPLSKHSSWIYDDQDWIGLIEKESTAEICRIEVLVPKDTCIIRSNNMLVIIDDDTDSHRNIRNRILEIFNRDNRYWLSAKDDTDNFGGYAYNDDGPTRFRMVFEFKTIPSMKNYDPKIVIESFAQMIREEIARRHKTNLSSR